MLIDWIGVFRCKRKIGGTKVTQSKKSGSAAAGKKRKSAKGGVSWKPRQAENRSGLISIIVLVGVIVILGAYFAQNSAVFADRAAIQAAEESTVRLNEIVSENTSTLITERGDVPDWVEITNTGSSAVQIGKYALMIESNINKMFSFPDYLLQPDECLVIRCEGSDIGSARSDWSAAFKLDASGGDTLVLLNAQGKAIDAVQLPELSADIAYVRDADGAWSVGTPTPGAANDSAAGDYGGVQLVQDAVEISEVMSSNTLYLPDENGEYHDYVELHNRSGASVSLKGWYLSDSSDKLKRWAFPEINLPAGGYLTVYCSGYNRAGDAAYLHSDFKIGSAGESIYLTRADGYTVSMVEVPALTTDQAYSLVSGKWTTELAPTPGVENTAEMAAQVQQAIFGSAASGVCISEIMASPTEQNYDWVEIYNASAQAVDLSNYGLSDDPDKPRRWQFPQGTTIQPGEYMGIFLSGTESGTLNGYLNADFALSAEGGYTVTLSDPSGRIFDAVYVPKQYGGISYGRVSGQSGFFFFESGTPGSANSGTRYRGRAAEAQASVQGGLFTSGDQFSVELTAPAGSRIYYTLDCTDPTDRSTLYTGPISISGNTILRSRVYCDGDMPSLIDTQSYLYDVNLDGASYVVSLVSDPDNLFSDERGIMVKGPNALEKFPYGSMNRGANFWMDWEREGHVELFLPEGEMAVSQGCGLKLHGQYSRATDVKAFKVFARSQYGDNRFDYPIFSERDYEDYQSFLLRASGQDWDMTFMRDSILSALAKDTSVMYQETEIGVCYLNGQYYSLYNLRERISKFSICQFEGWEGMEDDIDLIKANDRELQGSNASFEELLAYVKSNDPSSQAFYDYLDGKIDIQNYIEYMAIEIFVGNGDTLNVKRYRNSKADGKWRWCLFDLDWAFYVDTDSIGRWLTPGGMGTNKYTDNTLFIACMKNPAFREQFLSYFGEQMATTFTTENVLSLFSERYARIEGLLEDYRNQWNITSMSKSLKKLYDYCETRPAKLLGYFQEEFNFSESEFNRYFGDAVAKIEEYAAKGGN